MALVSKIREKSGLIVFIVGLGLLLFIIPFDSIYSFFGGRGEQPIGEVFGKPIYPSEWDVMAEFNQSTGQYSTIPNGDMYKMSQARNFFQTKMFDTIINTEVGKIGLRVSTNELKDYLIFGDNPSPVIVNRYTYKNEQGQEFFSKDSLFKEYNFFADQASTASGADKARFTDYWHNVVEVPVKRQRLIAKYVAMAKYAVVGTIDEATKLQIQENSKLTLDFIAKEASTITDSTVSVSEDKVKSYYEEHKEDIEWKIEEDVANIEFVLINVEATPEDEEAMVKKATELKTKFAETDNDTAFIAIKSDITFDDVMEGKAMFDVIPGNEFDPTQTIFSNETAAAIMAAKEGDVIGPVIRTIEGEAKVILAKVRAIGQETKVRHILVTDLKLADSISNALIADTSSFAVLAEEFTTDPGFTQNGGYYDVGPATRFVATFKEFALANGAGTIGVVPSQFGYHVMEIVSKGEEKRAMAYLVKDVEPSESTRNQVYEQQGFGFMEAAQSNYDAALTKFGFEALPATLRISLPLVDLSGNNQLYNPETTIYNEALTNWIFAEGRQTGDVSVPIQLKDGRFLVASIKGISSFGVPTYDIVKNEMRAKLVEEAKLAHIKNMLKGVGSLSEAEGILGGSGITSNSELTLDMNGFPGVGAQDGQAVAKAFLVKNLNELTIIEGNGVVYVVVVKDRNITPVATDKTEEIAKVSGMRQSYIDNTIEIALLKMADVRDWRVKAQVYYANNE